MSERVTVELPESLAQHARAVAAQTQRRLEDVLVEWIGRAVPEAAVESLSDEQLLELCDRRMDAGPQEELSELLDGNREGRLSGEERSRLDNLMRLYRHGLVRKVQALKVAAIRGLKPRLDDGTDVPSR